MESVSSNAKKKKKKKKSSWNLSPEFKERFKKEKFIRASNSNKQDWNDVSKTESKSLPREGDAEKVEEV